MLEIVIPALSGVLGAGVGAFGTYKAAKIKLKSEVVSKSRRDWIEDLRSCVAEFQSSVNYLNGVLSAASSNQPNLMSKAEESKLMNKSGFLKHRIKLLINPEETEHADLVEKVDELHRKLLEVTSSSASASNSGKSIGELQEELTRKAQLVMKSEWEKTKDEIS